MKHKLLLLSLLFLFTAASEAQTWEWAIQTSRLQKVKVSQADDQSVYVTGIFQDSCSVNGLSVPGVPAKYSVLIMKLSSSGMIEWHETLHTYTEMLLSDVEGNNIYVAGTFYGSMTGLVSDSADNTSVFMLGLSGSGNLLFYKNEGGSGSQQLTGMVVQNSRIFICGEYSGSTAFSGISLTPSYKSECYFAAYELDGSMALIKEIIVDSASSSASGIKTDPAGNIYVYGHFVSDITIGNVDTTFYIDEMTYYAVSMILEFDPNGHFTALHNNVDGWFEGMVDFCETGSHSIRLLEDWGCNHCSTGTIINSVESATGVTDWQFQEGSNYSSGWTDTPGMWPGDLSVTEEAVYVAGGYLGDHLAGADSIHGEGMYLFKLDHSGNFSDVITIGSMSASDLSDYRSGALIVAGELRDSAVIGVHQLNPADPFYSGFIAKYNEAVTGSVDHAAAKASGFSLYPNPSSGSFTLMFNEPASAKICIYDSMGKCIFSDQTENTNEKRISIVPARGIYLLKVESGSSLSCLPLIIQ